MNEFTNPLEEEVATSGAPATEGALEQNAPAFTQPTQGEEADMATDDGEEATTWRAIEQALLCAAEFAHYLEEGNACDIVCEPDRMAELREAFDLVVPGLSFLREAFNEAMNREVAYYEERAKIYAALRMDEHEPDAT